MREYMRKHFVRLGTTVIDQWAYEWENHVIPPHRYLGNMTRSEYLRYRVADLKSKSVLVMTHSFFYEFMKKWDHFSFATLLRDPVKRIISQFHFSKRTFERDKDAELNKWLDEKTSFEYNLQTAALCGAPSLELNEMHLEMAKANLHAFDFIGFVDRYELSIKLFNRIYSIKETEKLPWLNATTDELEIPEDLALVVQERGKYDIAYAQNLFRAKLAAFEMIDSQNPEVAPPTITFPTNY